MSDTKLKSIRDLNDLYYFVQVVDHSGFAPAGRALAIPKSKLSRRIALLEESLGVRLIQRSSRHFSVTEIGHMYYQRCVAMLVEADSAQEIIERHRSEPQGSVRLSCPLALLDYGVNELLARYMAEYPHVNLEIESTNRRVDVIREGFDLALRVRFPPLEDSDLIMKVLGESTQHLVASPTLIDRMGGLPNVEQLAGWPALSDEPVLRNSLWQLQTVDGAAMEVPYQARMVCDDRMTLLQAALQGIGVVQMPALLVAPHLQDGRLVDVAPGWNPRAGIIHAVFPSRRGLVPAIRALLDFLGEEFSPIAQAASGVTAVPGNPLNTTANK